jgi:hypothetical protein
MSFYAVGQIRKVPTIRHAIAFGFGGAVTLDGVIFSARGILLLAPAWV